MAKKPKPKPRKVKRKRVPQWRPEAGSEDNIFGENPRAKRIPLRDARYGSKATVLIKG